MSCEGPFKRQNATLGKDCTVSPYCSLENAVLGNGVVIRDGVQLKNVIVGDFTRISRNVILYSSEKSRPVQIGKYCWFSFGVFGEATGGEILIGDYVVIAHSTTLLTSSGPGSQSPIMDALFPVDVGPIVLGKHSWIGAHCVLLPGARFEEGVVMGANSLAVASGYEAWSIYAGSPAKLRKKLDPQKVEAATKHWHEKGL